MPRRPQKKRAARSPTQQDHGSGKDLPPCPGPKLHAFPLLNSNVKWGERLDAYRGDQPDSQAYVFKAEIRSQEYAVKIVGGSVSRPQAVLLGLPINVLQFKPYDTSDIYHRFQLILGYDFPQDIVAYHTDPFYAECRAYGCIKQAEEKALSKKPEQADKTGSERRKKTPSKKASKTAKKPSSSRGTYAVPCHGYLVLEVKDLCILEEKGIQFLYESVPDEVLREVLKTEPIRAIVKDFVHDEGNLNPRHIGKALKGICALNKLGIYNSDIQVENFKDWRLVDFGSAWTEEHCILNAMTPDQADDMRRKDLRMFDDMIEAEGIKTHFRALPNPDFCTGLWARRNESKK